MVPRAPTDLGSPAQHQQHLRPPAPPHSFSNLSKLSNRSHSSSLADDEHSSTGDVDSMFSASDGDADGHRRDPPRYAGEDTRLTSRKELAGWYAYGFAAEVFVICGIGSFIPITLEQLARENGVLLADGITPCGASSMRPRLPYPGSGSVAATDRGQCVVYILGVEINTASFAMYTFSISVLIQALLVVSISCAADHGNSRKRLLLAFAYIGAVAMMFFIAIVPRVYLLGALLAIIANTCFGASFVLLNSFLPLLVRHHPLAQYGSEDNSQVSASVTMDDDAQSEMREATETTSLLSTTSDHAPLSRRPPRDTSVELQLLTQISSKGIGIGYSAALFLQCLCIIVLILLKSTTFSLRLVLTIVGLWWFVFTIPADIWLRPRPGPPLPRTDQSWTTYLVQAWTSLYRTFTLARRLKDITLFLLAWFLLSDAIATVSGTAVLYAKTELYMKPSALGLINVIATTAGVLGAFSWAWISRVWRLRPHQTILACICLFEVIPLYGLLGFLPCVRRWGVLGLQQAWEMYPLGFVYGFVLGGLSSYCRALFGELIPEGSEAAFYALYAITDKGSSIFGPAVVGAITDATGGIRPAFWFLAVLVGLPAPLIMGLDVERGKREARALADVLAGPLLVGRREEEEEEEEERDSQVGAR